MKKIFILVGMAIFLTGCFTENNQRIEALNRQMSVEWLKTHIITGKTTKDEISTWFGQPIAKTASKGSEFDSSIMPDEIWTYSVRFSKTTNSWVGGSTDYWIKSIAFSFKNGFVSNYNVTQVNY